LTCDPGLATLRDLVARADNARASTDHETYLRSDHAFCTYLVHMVHNGLLQDAADRLLLHSFKVLESLLVDQAAPAVDVMSHSRLVEALRVASSEDAARAMRGHLLASRPLSGGVRAVGSDADNHERDR
jgi:DNA-binding GntR family transcriptional regulator